MIRLTTLYSLADGQDEDEFIHWRNSEHRKYVNSMSNVVRNEFSRIDDIAPDGVLPTFRFQTIVDWPDRESFEAAFYSKEAQLRLRKDQDKIGTQVFIVSELLSCE
ncbi:MAG: hypothetical protein RIA65_02815 [Woeseia sp.]